MPQNAMPFAVRLVAHDSPEWREAVALRRAVLRTPLGLDFSAEDLARESTDSHFAAFRDGRMIGTVAMTRLDPATVKLRQMAVAEDQRGLGIGDALLHAFEAHAGTIGARKITLAARQTARRFYERNGYTTEGEGFVEVTIPHIRMTKTL